MNKPMSYNWHKHDLLKRTNFQSTIDDSTMMIYILAQERTSSLLVGVDL